MSRLTALLAGLWAVLAHAQAATPAEPPPTLVQPQAQCPAPPQYPESERAAGREGKVVLHLQLDVQGRLEQSTVFQGMGAAFDEAALRAIAACTFTPGVQDGKPVPTLIAFTIDFVPPPPPAPPEAPVPEAPGARGMETRVVGSRLLPDAPEVDATPQVSRYHISAADIDRTPGAMEDISRVVATLPGVAADPDLLATFFVRGGGPNEVLFYLDGVPLANPFHLGGFATLYNPMMLESADFYAGSAPGRYEPALSGVLDVHYASGETSTPRVWADVSMQSAKLRVDTPTGIEGLSVSLAGRRSFFELYFAGLRALGIVGSNYVAPDIGEYLVRAHYRKGPHTLTATYLHATDGFSFLVKPGEEVLVDFAGGLTLSNRVLMAILQERTELGGENALSFTVALTRDASHTSLDSDTTWAQDARRDELFARADLELQPSEATRSRMGLQFARRDLRFGGEVPDSRAVAPWSAQPFVTTDTGLLDISPRVLRNTLAGYVE